MYMHSCKELEGRLCERDNANVIDNVIIRPLTTMSCIDAIVSDILHLERFRIAEVTFWSNL